MEQLIICTKEQGREAIEQHYSAAAEQLANQGAFGKELNRKARKLALKMGGYKLPEGVNIAWCSPEQPQTYRR